MMTEPGSFSPGKNGEVVRIVMHQTWAYQSIVDQASINVRQWTQDTHAAHTTNPNSAFGVSAHFTVEASGRIIQHVDTADVAKGTGAFTGGSVHIEFASRDEPLTNDQLHHGADLMAWIQKVHPAVKLVVVGTSNKDPGPNDQKGITCHSFVEIVGKKLGQLMKPAPNEPKTDCPGKEIVKQMNTIAVLASVRRTLI